MWRAILQIRDLRRGRFCKSVARLPGPFPRVRSCGRSFAHLLAAGHRADAFGADLAFRRAFATGCGRGRRCGVDLRGRGHVCRPGLRGCEWRRRYCRCYEGIRDNAGFVSVHGSSLAGKDVCSSKAATYQASGEVIRG